MYKFVRSRTGVQQGDPLGPLLFALAIDEAVRSILSPFNLWYLDDATIGGSVESITEDLSRLIPSLRNLGLEVNVDISEILNLNYHEADFPNVNMLIQGFITGAQTTQPSEAIFLGCPLSPSGLKAHLAKKDMEFRNLTSSLLELDSHIALFSWKNSIYMPKLLYTLRCLPCYSHPDILTYLEKSLKSCTEAVLNICFDEIGWTQAKLPVRFGGIGLRSPKDLAPHAHFSSISRSRQLVSEVLLPFNELSLELPTADFLEFWTNSNLQIPSEMSRQRDWDEIWAAHSFSTLQPALDQHRQACLLSAAHEHSGSWLDAYPTSSTGSLLDNETLRIGVALRLGLDVCAPHPCRCGGTVDVKGLHPLSCRRSAGRSPRHGAINDVISRALNAAGFPNVFEPAGLDRGDGKLPDGMTTLPFRNGNCLIWDATCADTWSPSALMFSLLPARPRPWRKPAK
ncbi:uncharacterized protein LOC115232047 [Octopus sinensis]|uniref:Uncharacterized protein LOC115232047 n=1 Tax=Octopus sinensis TaxID=2607531 RepID=A0A6P7U610_9MOLL|nr:uncharacterized protein LOC115232047 [Octopus sinensis]